MTIIIIINITANMLTLDS